MRSGCQQRLSTLASLHQHHAPAAPCIPPPVLFDLPLHVGAAPITKHADVVLAFFSLGAFARVFHLLLEAPLQDDASQCCAHLPQDEPRAITDVHRMLVPAFLDFFRGELGVQYVVSTLLCVGCR